MATKPKMKTVVYRGHLKRLSDPRNPSRIIDAGEEIEVPETMQLCPLWEEVTKTKAKAPKADAAE